MKQRPFNMRKYLQENTYITGLSTKKDLIVENNDYLNETSGRDVLKKLPKNLKGKWSYEDSEDGSEMSRLLNSKNTISIDTGVDDSGYYVSVTDPKTNRAFKNDWNGNIKGGLKTAQAAAKIFINFYQKYQDMF